MAVRTRMYDGHHRGFFYSAGEILRLWAETLWACKDAWRNVPSILEQMVVIGVNTLPIASVMALFIGMVLALQTGIELKHFGAESLALGAIVGLSLVRELSPVMTGILVAGMSGSSIAAQIGTMTVDEEIDALRTMGIDPVGLLAMQRFIAGVLMVPILVIYSNAIGIVGGSIVGTMYIGVHPQTFFRNLFDHMDMHEIGHGLTKAAVFGGIVAIVGCYYGFKTVGGAAGVGKSTTSAVVVSFMLILISNYFVTRLLL